MLRTRTCFSLLAAAVLFLAAAPGAWAQTDTTWEPPDSDNLWNNALNWDSGVPTNVDTAIFGISGVGTNDVDLTGASAVAAKISFQQNSNTGYTLSGDALTLGNSSADGIIENTTAVRAVTNNRILSKILSGNTTTNGLTVNVMDGIVTLAGQVGDGSQTITLTGTVTGSATSAAKLDLTNIDAANANQISATSNVTANAYGTVSILGKGTTSSLGAGKVTLNGGKLIAAAQLDATLGLLGEYYGMQGRSNGPGTVLSSIAYMDQYSPGGASYIPAQYQWGYVRANAPIDFPGDADSPNNRNPFEYAAGDPVRDNLNNPIVQGNAEGGIPGANDHAARWSGSIYIATPGTYRFETRSDDGTCLWINGTLVVANDYWQGFTGRNGTYTFTTPGYHTIVMGFYEGGGGAGCDLRWDPTGGTSYTLLPGSILYHGTGPRGSVVAEATLGNNVDVLVNSAVEVNGTVTLGTLNLSNNAGVTFSTTSGGAVRFADTTFNGGAVALNTGAVPTRLGILSDHVTDATVVTKTGAADLILDQTLNFNDGNNTKFKAAGGRIVVVGEAGALGSDPLGGAQLALAGGTSIILSSKNGNYTTSGAIFVDANGTIEAKREATGTASNAEVTLSGNGTMAAGTAVNLRTADGYTLNLSGTWAPGAGDPTINVGPGKVKVSGSIAAIDTINVLAGGNLNITGFSGLGATNVVNIAADGYMNLATWQTTLPTAINVASGGGVGGDLTGAQYSGGSQNVFLGTDSTFGITAGPSPTRLELGGAILYRGIVSMSGFYDGLGDNGTDAIYKGASISDGWSDAGAFVGTLKEATTGTPAGFEIKIQRPQFFGANDASHTNPGLSATIDAASGHEVLITGTPKMTIGAPLLGTADLLTRRGTAPTASDRGTLGREIVEFEWVSNLLPAGKTLQVQYGTLYLDKDNNMRNAVQNGATVKILDYGQLVCNDNLQTGTWHFAPGGYVWTNNSARLSQAGATKVWEDGAWLHLNYDGVNWATHGLPTNRALNVIMSTDSTGTGVLLGNHSILTHRAGGGRAIRFGSGFRLNDQAGGTVQDVRFIANQGGDLRFGRWDNGAAEDGIVDLTNAPGTRATLYAGTPAGTERWLPLEDGGGDGGTITRDRVWEKRPATGEVRFTRGYFTLGNVQVDSGTVVFGQEGHDTGLDSTLCNIDMNGWLHVKTGARAIISHSNGAWRYLPTGTLGTVHKFDNGTFLEHRLRNTGSSIMTINQAVEATGVGGTGYAELRFDHSEQGGVGDANLPRGYYYPNVTIRDGARIYLRRYSMQSDALRLDLAAYGNSTISMDDFALTRVTTPGGPARIQFGDMAVSGGDGDIVVRMWGPVSADATLDLMKGWFDIWADPVAGTLRCAEDGNVHVYVNREYTPGSGNYVRNWGAGTTIVMGGNQQLEIDVQNVPNAEEPNRSTNRFAGTVRVENNVAGVDARIRGNRYNDNGNGDWHTRAVVREVQLENGADVEYNENWTFVVYENLNLLGATGQVSNYGGWDGYAQNGESGLTVGHIGLAGGNPGPATLTMHAQNRFRMNGTVTGVDLVKTGGNSLDIVTGFNLNGRTLTINDGWMDWYSAPGAGQIIDNGRQVYCYQGAPGATWGTGLNVTMNNGAWIRVSVDEHATAGQTITNEYQGTFTVNDTRAGVDAYLRAERAADRAGIGLVKFGTIALGAGAEVQLETGGGARSGATVALGGDARLNILASDWVELAVTADTTDKTLTIDKSAGGWNTPEVSLALGGTANANIDMVGSGAFRLRNLSLGGRTLTIQRTGSESIPVEVWPDCGDFGAGTVNIVGYDTGGGVYTGGGMEIRRGKNGDLAETLTSATAINIANGRMIRGFVRDDQVERVSNINAQITVQTDANPATVDAVFQSRRSDVGGDVGPVGGRVVYGYVTLGADARVELVANDASKVQLGGGGGGGGGVSLAGNATIVNNSSGDRVFLGNISDGGGGFDLTLVGNQMFRLNQNLAVNKVTVAGQAALDPGATVAVPNGFLVLTGAQLRVNAGGLGSVFDVQTGGALVIGHAGFNGSFDLGGGVDGRRQDHFIVLASDYSYADGGIEPHILIAKADYAGSLTVDQAVTEVGAVAMNSAILSPILGNAAQVVFRGGDGSLLTLGSATSGTILGDGPGGRTVLVDRGMAFAAAGGWTGGTTINSGTTTVTDIAGLGSGNVVLNGASRLVVNAAGFDLAAGAVTVNTGTTLDLRTNAAADLVFAGGTIEAGASVTESGALTDGDVAEHRTNGNTLTFSQGLAMTAARIWTINSGTVTMQGNVTGGQNLTKLGEGTLRLEGAANDIALLTIGSSPGGYVITNSAPTSVIINAGSAYSVVAPTHNYGEVNTALSQGVIALSGNSSGTLDFDDADDFLTSGLTLGALLDSEFTGSLTPDFEDVGTNDLFTYKLGGGPAMLTVSTVLANQGTPGVDVTNLQIGWMQPGGNDPIPLGTVKLNATNTLTGAAHVYGNLVFGVVDALASASAVNVYDGGAVDLNGLAVDTSLFNMQPGGMGSGAIASSGGSLNQATLSALYPTFWDYVLGGPGTGNTLVLDGALINVTDGFTTYYKNVIKVGTNQVTLETPAAPGASSNDYGGGITRIEGGTLTVNDLSSLGGTYSLLVLGSGQADLNRGGAFGGTISLEDTAGVDVAAGETVTALGLNLSDAAGRSTLTGGGALSIGDTAIFGSNGARLALSGSGTTLTARLSSGMPNRAFTVGDGATLNFATSDTGNVARIGWLLPGSTLAFGGGLNATVAGQYGLTFDVDPALGAAGYSDPDGKHYVLDVAAGSTISLFATWQNNEMPLGTAVYTEGTTTHRPVAHVEKTGAGELRVTSRAFERWAGDTRVLAWTVSGGTLGAYGDSFEHGLGATASAVDWLIYGESAPIARQHLEGLVVKDGATLAWKLDQGFLPASAYGGLPAGEGDGFNPGEFVLYNGATLRSSDAALNLGFQYGGNDYLCYPTIKNPVAAPNAAITVGGTINFRSGIAVDASVTSGLVDLNVAGNSAIQLSSNIATDRFGNANPGIDKVRNLTLGSASTTTVYQTHAALESTVNDTATLVFDPGTGNTIQFGNGSATMQQTDGLLHARTGTTDMGNTVVDVSTNNIMFSRISFVEHIDDSTRLLVDGQNWIQDGTWNVPVTSGTRIVSTGWHNIEVRVGNGTGGAGAMWAGGTFGFGVDYQGRGTTNEADYTRPVDPGDASVLRYSPDGGTTWLAGLQEGRVTGSFNLTDPNPASAVTLDVRMAQTNAKPPWGDDETWVYSGQFYFPGNLPVVPEIRVDAGAELRLGGFSNLGLLTNNGVMVIQPPVAGIQTSTVASVVMSGSAVLDLTTGNLVVDYADGGTSPLPQITAWIRSGYNKDAGYWDGTGIMSSTARDDPWVLTGVGVMDNTDWLLGGKSDLEGTAVDASSVLVKYTWWGDANLDGEVTFDDYDVIDYYYWFPVPAEDNGWWTGDFDYDGNVDFDDYDLIDYAYWFQTGPLGGSTGGGGFAGVPEPATIGLLALGGLVVLARRRRR